VGLLIATHFLFFMGFLSISGRIPRTDKKPFVCAEDSMSLQDAVWLPQVREIAEAVAKDNFLELFDLTARQQGKKLVLTVVIDKKSGPVNLEECTAVSRDMEKRLDDLNLIESTYLLQVASPGMDRPLRNLEDCQRFAGSLAQFVFKESVEGQMTFRGRLGGVKDGRVELVGEQGQAIWAPFESVKRAHLVVEL
jgi:ribosome maturation factor RimP